MEVRTAYIMEKEYIESNMSLFIVALCIDYIPTKIRKLSRTRQKLNRQGSRTYWRRMKKMGWDDQMGDLKTKDQVHLRPGDGSKRWDGIIR